MVCNFAPHDEQGLMPISFFSFLVSKIWRNLTKISKISWIYTQKQQQKFPISLSENGEIFPEK
jgi:hypothetical protein